jgi:hypothetical protein
MSSLRVRSSPRARAMVPILRMAFKRSEGSSCLSSSMVKAMGNKSAASITDGVEEG